jgi:hypothetical protein
VLTMKKVNGAKVIRRTWWMVLLFLALDYSIGAIITGR